jgi:putative DNA primase/helicase
MTFEDLVARFRGPVKWEHEAQWLSAWVFCSAHEDGRKRNRQSLRLSQHRASSNIQVKCFADDPVDQVLAKVGLRREDIRVQHTTIAEFDYRDETGSLLLQAIRYPGKVFKVRRPDPSDPARWIHDAKSVRRTLYRLPELQGARTVFVAEGEACADCLRERFGVSATTNIFGAGKWRDDYPVQLVAAGCRAVVVLPDNDDPGREHADQVARSCHAAGLRVFCLTLPDLPDKGDICDWAAAGHSRQEFVALASQAEPWPDPATEVLGAGREAHEKRGSEEGGPAEDPGMWLSTWRGDRRLVATRVDHLVATPVAWWWRRRLPRGKVLIIAGDPGLGKSYLVTDVHARASTGAAWPDEADMRTPVHSIVLSAEDGAEDTIKLRLDGQGANGSLIHVVRAIRLRQGGESLVSLDRDLPHLEELVTAFGAGLVSIDPINAYLPVRDSYKDSDIRQALAPLALFAERTGVTVVLIMHLTKDTERQALYRILGGIGYAAAVRVVLMVAKDPRAPGRRYFVNPKNNLAPRALPLAFTIEERPDDRSALVWEPEPIADLDVEGVVRGVLPDQGELKEPGAREMARDFLREMLDDGTQWAVDVIAAAQANGITRSTLFKARHDLHLRAGKVGQPDSTEQAWYWWLPGTRDVRPKSLAPWERRRVSSLSPRGNSSSNQSEEKTESTITSPKSSHPPGERRPFGSEVGGESSSRRRRRPPATATPEQRQAVGRDLVTTIRQGARMTRDDALRWLRGRIPHRPGHPHDAESLLDGLFMSQLDLGPDGILIVRAKEETR